MHLPLRGLAAVALAVSLVLVTHPGPVHAQAVDPAGLAEGVIIGVQAGAPASVFGVPQQTFTVTLRITTGPDEGKFISLPTSTDVAAAAAVWRAGDRVLLDSSVDGAGGRDYFIADRVRRAPLYGLILLFVVITILVGRLRGIASLGGMALSFFVIFFFLLPRILAGHDPIVASILAAAMIIPTTFYLSHGLNRKTTSAIVGTMIALIVTGVLAHVSIEATRLSGFAAEETAYLQVSRGGTIDVHGLLLASIIIGLLGILDDVSVSQAATVFQLRRVGPHLRPRDVYARAMDVGTDHIASLVNTLVLVYASAAMPLLLLFLTNAGTLTQVINFEIVAEEIVRTLVASIGLILAVPITTAVAVAMASSDRLPFAEPDHNEEQSP